MAKLNALNIDLPETPDDDPRIGHLINQAVKEGEEPEAVLIGFPSDEGARRMQAPTGAAQGPDAIREELYRMTPHPKNYEAFTQLIRHTQDLGNLEVTGNLEEDQKQLGAAIAPYLAKETTVIILGGNHETSMGHFLGYAENGEAVSIFNMDAHPDVEPLLNGKATAGSPFQQILEHDSELCRSYTVAGLQPFQSAKTHLDYIKAKGGRYFLKDAVNLSTFKYILEELSEESMMVSVDLDVVDQTAAPGVTWPNADGIDKDLVLKTAYRAAMQHQVRSIDIVEMNPEHDIHGVTARFGALVVWNFLLGRALR